jgi:hypothetical protein
MILRTTAAMTLGLWCAVVCAQQPASAAGTGMVSGHVTCGDTQRPARFANVVLFGVPAQLTPAANPSPDASSEEQLKAVTDALMTLGKTNMVQTQTGTDGAYTATDVAPGDYYVLAGASGYISPMNQVQAAIEGGADVKKPLPGLQVVHVTADHTVTSDVTMERGAAVSGTILWDDGTPLTGAVMSVVPAKGDAKQPPSQFAMLAVSSALASLSISDDLGHYRISGLAPGDYVIQAIVQSGQQMGLGAGMNLSKMMANMPLEIYAPAAFHKADAKPVTLHRAEDLRDQAMTLKLGGLHSVSGTVSSAVDRHGINSGTVRLQDTVDKDFLRAASVDAAGNFTVTFVPPGTYTMKVTDAEDTEPKPADKDKPNLFGPGTKTIRSYVDGKLNVIVTDSDLTGQNVLLAVDNNPKKEPDFGALFGNDDTKPTPK